MSSAELPAHGERWQERFGELLKDVARRSIAQGLRTGRPLAVDPEVFPTALRAKRASFVTLRRNGKLRGCIGTLEADVPLVVGVAENAFKAAFRDPRFSPLAEGDLSEIESHISVLSSLERVEVSSESDLLAKLRPGVDGVVLRQGLQRGTFLPSVWEELPDAAQFVRQLKRKAGLPAEHWSDTLEVWRYTAESIE
jgi:AmmeMemoRadiSam system protein A